MRLKAPRGLKEPVCWSSSSFSVRSAVDAEGSRLEIDRRGAPDMRVDQVVGGLDVETRDIERLVPGRQECSPRYRTTSMGPGHGSSGVR